MLHRTVTQGKCSVFNYVNVKKYYVVTAAPVFDPLILECQKLIPTHGLFFGPLW